MSWFGEQLSTFTGKITDFTKDMLPDAGGISTSDPGDEENLSFSSKHLLELCKEKNAEISTLMNEKLSLEKSIEELDSQHQEAISELLHLKNEAVKENTSLRNELLKQKETFSAKSLLQKFEHNYLPKELTNNTSSFTHSMDSQSLNNFNFVNIIGILWKSFNEVTLNSVLEWLKEQKILLEAESLNVSDSSASDVLNRISNYIMLLQLISENPKKFSPLIDEIATVIHFFLSSFADDHSRFSVPGNLAEHSIISDKSTSDTSKTSDYSSQIKTQDFDNIKDLFSTIPVPVLRSSNNEKTVVTEKASFSSQPVQTNVEGELDHTPPVSKLNSLEQEKMELQARVSELEKSISALQEHQCSILQNPPISVSVQTERMDYESSCSNSEDIEQSSQNIDDSDSFKLMELQTYVEILEQEKIDYEDQILKLQEIVDRPTSSAITQTDDVLVTNSDNDSVKLMELQTYVEILEQEKIDYEDQILKLQEIVDRPTSSVITQTDDVLVTNSDSDSVKLMELQTYVEILEQEKSDFEDQIQILKLQEFVDRPTSSAVTQTDDDLYDVQVHELDAGICILEQDKADLQDELCSLKSSFEKDMSSAEVQTEEDSNLFDLLQSKISDLTQMIELSDNDYNDSMQKVNEDLNTLKMELNCKNSVIMDKESIIQSLENDSRESKLVIESLTEKLRSLDNMNVLEEKLRIYENFVKEKEVIIQSLECELKEYKATIEDLTVKMNDLEEKLRIYENFVKEKEAAIQSLEYELKEHKATVEDLTVKAKQADDIKNMNNELKQKESNLLEKMNIIQSLESEVEEYKAFLSDLILKFGNIDNSLRKVILLKQSITSEEEDKIKTLKNKLDDFEVSVYTLIDKAQKLNEFNNLVEELKSKESIINEKSNQINDLEQSLETYKITVETLKHQISNLSPPSSAAGTQTTESGCSCKLYESEIQELQESIKYKEMALQQLQTSTDLKEVAMKKLQESIRSKEEIDIQTERVINELKAELESYKSVIAIKDSTLDSLKADLEKYKCEVKKFSDETNKGQKPLSINADKNLCSCKKYEAELEELKSHLSNKEKEVLAVKNDLNSNINDLKEILESKDLLVIDKEETIQSLKIELEEIKKNVKEHLNDLKVFKGKEDYAKDIDTVEEQELKMMIGNCNRCKSLLNAESTDNDLKNEVQVLQDKLKALEMDKNQLLCVLNEKTQECSSLKAEVHKLTNIVASEKQALYKLQQDNCLLKESRDNTDPELTKEAIQKLSVIIRDKDLEIDSLKQKNVTLTTLIQDSTSVPDHLQSLIEEKENLIKQINVFKSDRDKIMAKYNSIDKDCRQYAAEVKKLKSALSEQKEKFDVLEQKHFSVAQQYEEKQKSLINTQNEMIALKQRVSDLEQQQVDIKEKYSELLNKFNSDSMVQLTKDELEEKNSLIAQLTAVTKEKDNLIEEKDCLIHDLSQQIKFLKIEHDQQQQNISVLQTKVEELTAKLKEYEAVVEKHQNEKENLEIRIQDKSSELGLLKDMNERLNMNLKEKEFTIQSMTEKISSLSHYISSDHTSSDTVDINQILADSESLFSKAQSLYKERDETILALNQSKQENQSLRNEIQRMKSNEIHLKKELERLRTHLLEIEENYTAEALRAEEREKELRDELVEVKRRAEISNSAVVDTSQRASIQIASLQEQLSMIASQRDQALAQVSTLEDKVHQHSASISKLQLVLEQMQRSNEKKVKDVEKKFIAELEKKKQLCNEFEEKLHVKETQLEESTQALEAASRLSEQLDAKEEVIAHLKKELSKTESKFKSTAQEIDNIKSNTEGKVDRMVMKSLVLGYFSTPPGQKSEVVRLLARVLDFNQEEMEKAGIVVGRNAQRNEQRGFFSSVFGRLPVLSSDRTPAPPEKSFTTLFVQFLENESQPFVPMPFPAEKMVHEHPIHKQPTKKSPTPERKNLSRSNPLLLDIDSAFPTFSPVPAIEYSQSPAPSILREVLE